MHVEHDYQAVEILCFNGIIFSLKELVVCIRTHEKRRCFRMKTLLDINIKNILYI